MRTFLTKSFEAGLFNNFYEQKQAELEGAVEGLFGEFFAEEFGASETPNELEMVALQALIKAKF